MSKIEQKFNDTRKSKKIACMPFLVGGDPDYKTSLNRFRHLAYESDLLEIGVPFSDPIADGITIQEADQRALKNGATPDTILSLISELRKFTNIPITLLIYANLIQQKGIDVFYRLAHLSGVDGVLIPDVPFEESEPYIKAARKHKIDHIALIAPTTDENRIKRIVPQATGFIYLVSTLGVTGIRKKLPSSLNSQIAKIKKYTHLPIAVGFGISIPKHVIELEKMKTDGFIVGSALIKLMETGNTETIKLKIMKEYVRKMNGL
jgi:tryptophan synthase alpha chain